MIWIGVDPGASGGLCCFQEEGVVSFRSMPRDEGELWKLIRGWSQLEGDKVAAIEQVQGYIGKRNKDEEGDGGQPGSAMFKFGQSYGVLRGMLVAAGFERDRTLIAVPPQVWQRGLFIPPRRKDESKGQWKSRLKDEAERRVPWLKLTLATADAVLLAIWLRESYTVRSEQERPTEVEHGNRKDRGSAI